MGSDPILLSPIHLPVQTSSLPQSIVQSPSSLIFRTCEKSFIQYQTPLKERANVRFNEQNINDIRFHCRCFRFHFSFLNLFIKRLKMIMKLQ